MKLRTLLAVLFCSSSAFAMNDVETVANVAEDRTLTTPIDLVITSAENALTGHIDIANDDAAVVFENVIPTDVIDTYLKNITISGENATNGSNCRVAIYRHGAIVLPRGKSYPALTVYTEPDFAGDSRTFSQGGRQASLGKFNNNIYSFKLKRGYMATLANHTDGTGYSHCYIADREDLEVNLPKTMAGRISMLRVFVWNWVSKKGCSDSRDANMMNTAHATWYYDWGAGTTSRTNHEYVPQRHHEAGNSNGNGWKGAWESWGNINASDETCTHVLGQNEPDNTSGGDEVYTYVTTIPDDAREKHASSTLADHAKEFLYSGKRIGTFACCNPNTGWVSEYVNYCRQNNIRIDFVATHYYIGGTDPAGCISRLKSLYDVTGLPVWATEWNNGANWTSEGGFSTDSEGWYSWGSGNDQYKNGVWLRDVLKRADSEPWLERLAVYNAVEWKRQITDGSNLTEGGKVWAKHLSKLAYDSKNGGISYFMPWNHHSPTDFTITYDNKKQIANLSWTNPNTDMTDSVVIERKEGSKWIRITSLPLNDNETMTLALDVKEYAPAMYTLRLTNYDCDGKKRTSTTTPSFTIAAANSVGSLQFGQLSIGNTESVTTDIETQEVIPYVVVGMVSNQNSSNAITNQVQLMSKTSFKFRFYPWQLPTPVDFTKAETADYMILPPNMVYHLSDDMMLISQKAGSVKGAETEIVFPEAFPEGVTPVVVAQQNTSTSSYAPVTVRVYDVTNTGFKVKLVRQEGVTSGFNAQNVNYFAASPGQIAIGNGKMLTVGRNNNVLVGGTTRQNVMFANQAGETQYFKNPIIVAASQTDNYEKASVFRQHSILSNTDGVYGINVRRQVDGTSTSTVANSAKNNGDYIGWFIISDDPNGTGSEDPIIVPTGITNLKNEQGFSVCVSNHAIYADGKNLRAYAANGSQVRLGTPLPKGIYIVTNGSKRIKVRVP